MASRHPRAVVAYGNISPVAKAQVIVDRRDFVRAFAHSGLRRSRCSGCQRILQMPLVCFVVHTAVRDAHCRENVIHFRLTVAGSHHRPRRKEVYLKRTARFCVVRARRSPFISDHAARFAVH